MILVLSLQLQIKKDKLPLLTNFWKIYQLLSDSPYFHRHYYFVHAMAMGP
jgi:hypothetical protein